MARRWMWAAAIAALAVSGCNQRNAEEQVGDGTLSSSTYSNPFFRFEITFPEGWKIQPKEVGEALQKAGSESIASAEVRKSAEAADDRIANLFTVFRFPPQEARTFNASIAGVAEDVSGFSRVKTGADYLLGVRQFLQQAPIPYQVGNFETVELGGETFDVMTVRAGTGGQAFTQRYYARVIDGFALLVITSFDSADAEAALEKSLETIRFDRAGE